MTTAHETAATPPIWSRIGTGLGVLLLAAGLILLFAGLAEAIDATRYDRFSWTVFLIDAAIALSAGMTGILFLMLAHLTRALDRLSRKP